MINPDPERYTDEGPLGAGGMGEVRRVRDTRLDRVLAMKCIRGTLLADPASRTRFKREARLTAQLEHPGIIPVHEVGELADGRLYYTMPVVQGRTLGDAIDEVHDAVGGRTWRPASSGWTFRRLVEAFRRVCDAVAYAHTRGVAHGDIKPDNIMLGAHGEVYVLDWGLASIVGSPATGGEPKDPGGPKLAGTPAYMAPERLWTAPSELGCSADVYALGAVLYHLLVGEPPYGSRRPVSVIQRLAEGPPEPVSDAASRRERPEPPSELASAIWAAMARDPDQRPVDAGRLGTDVGGWLEGTRQLERAQVLVDRARESAHRLAEARRDAEAQRARASTTLAELPPHAPAEQKRAAWELLALADELEVAGARREAELTRDLHAALALVPDLPEAHRMLADHHRGRHAAAEASGDAAAAERDEVALAFHDRLGRHRTYLEGAGTFTLHTDPAGAEAELFRHVERDRRLVLESARPLGTTPIVDEPLPMGSYVVRLRAPGCLDVRYPVLIDRQRRWDGVAPGETAPRAVVLPRRGDLAPQERYVPAGWFVSGGDRSAPGALPRRRIWLDGFVIDRHPVTHAELLAFLSELVDGGETERAEALVPRRAGAPGSGGGEPLYSRDGDGRFTLDDPRGGAPLDGREPAVCVTWEAACACAAWRAARDGQPWRLPGELEWEKAARGVDGRVYPWGRHLDPTFCNMRDSRGAAAAVAPVDDFPMDESPFGVRGTAGNVRDWCLDRFAPGGPRVVDGRWIPLEPATAEPLPDGALHDPAELVFGGPVAWPRVGRGGAWCVNPVTLRTAYRSWFAPGFPSDDALGFRLVRSYPGPASQ